MKKLLKEENWVYRNLLYISIGIFVGLIASLLLYPNFYKCVECKYSLSFYHIFLMVGAMLTLLWTNKRHKLGQKQYKHSQKQYEQAQETIFLNKVNTIYFEVIKLLSDEKTEIKAKKKSTASNLIDSIQASISFQYPDNEKKQKEMRSKILNFAYMNLDGVNLRAAGLAGANLRAAYLKDADLEGAGLEGADLSSDEFGTTNLKNANLIKANLESADLESADLEGAYLQGADLLNTNFTGTNLYAANFKDAKNLPEGVKKHLDENGRYTDPNPHKN